MKKALLFLFWVSITIALTAQDCLPGWQYFRNIQIDNTQGAEDLDNFTIRFTPNTAQLVSQGKLQANGADLRFVGQDCSELPYFMDSLATSPQNVIWVKIPFLAAGASTVIRVYYGNPNAAPASDGAATFLFFDDFEDGVIDTEKWESIGEYATFEESNGLLDYASTGTASGPRFKFARTVPSFQGPVYAECAASVGTSSTIGFSSSSQPLERIYFRYNNGAFSADTMDILAHLADTMTNGFATDTNYPRISVPKEQMNNLRIKIAINEDGHLSITEFSNLDNGQSNTTERIVTFYTMDAFHFCLSSFSFGSHALLDYVRIRKAVAVEPTVSLGIEISNPLTSLQEIEGTAYFHAFPNPARSQCTVNFQGPQPAQRLQVFDARGALILTAQNPSWPQQLDTSSYPAGVYLIQVEDALSNRYTRQLIVAGKD
ncbi:MAG: DUF2341 domain-containing protein [Phaeodactylibacter sp.]|nr:DUF2341 domain-containing protein [Phaeodactylibacter sp.]